MLESPTLTVSEHCPLHTPTLYPFGGCKCQLTKNLFNKKAHTTAPHLNTIIHTKTRKHAEQWILAGQSAPPQKIRPHAFINSILLPSMKSADRRHTVSLLSTSQKGRLLYRLHPCRIVREKGVL